MKVLAVFYKEWMLLWRDKVGLLFLFILPMCLVLFISLTSSPTTDQNNKIKMLLLNQDPQGPVSLEIVKALKTIHDFKITDFSGTNNQNQESLKEKVSSGEFQALIVIPAQTSQKIMGQIRPGNSPPAINSTPVSILFDPTLPQPVQSQIQSSLQLIAQTIELQLWQQMAHQLSSQKGIPTKNFEGIHVKTDIVATAKGKAAAPNEVQQNVPAWALFGMFFIITPLSGVIVKERRLGVVDRLWLAPVSLFSLMTGKIIAFIGINMLQLILMLAVGVFILPLFGMPTLNVTDQPFAILLVGLSAALAATGFGMLIGSWVRTPEQANVMGPFIIVILASIGGIFIPVYFLPDALKKLANFSPMHWALQAFLDIFVRNAGIHQLLPNIGKLIAFGILTTVLASFKMRRA